MYRVLAIVLMAYAICYPRVAAENVQTAAVVLANAPTRAERLMNDLSYRIQRPLDVLLAALARSGRG